MQLYSRSNLSILACVVAVWGAFPLAVLAQDATAARPKDDQPFPDYDKNHSQNLKDVDEIRFTNQWNDERNLSALKGKVVRLRFRLRNAKLYSFTIKES